MHTAQCGLEKSRKLRSFAATERAADRRDHHSEMKSSSPLQPAGHRWLPSSHHVHVAVLLALSSAAAHAAEGAARVRSSDGDEADDAVSLAPLPSCRKIDELCYQGTQQDIANVLKTDPLVRGHNRIATPQTHTPFGQRRWQGTLARCAWPCSCFCTASGPILRYRTRAC